MTAALPGAGLPRVFSAEPVGDAAGLVVVTDEEAAHHLRVRRVREGERVGLADGQGGLAEGALVRLARGAAEIAVDRAQVVPPLAPVHLLAPIGDRDRMLWLAEKATELGVSSWRSVLWHRSRSVSPRGEGPAFRQKLRARMISALLQSGNAWLPTLHDDVPAERALADAPAGTRLLLDAAGTPAGSVATAFPIVIALGPEGGLEPAERDRALEAGWCPVALGPTVLRFETAGVVALGVFRAS